MADGIAWDVAKIVMTGAAGFIGVWYGQRRLMAKDVKEAAAEEKKLRHEQAYVASVVVEHLERYIDRCAAIAYDNGTYMGQPAGERGNHAATTSYPEFDARTLDVNWQVFPPLLIYDIHAMRIRQENIENYLGGFDDDPPDYPDFFSTRRLLFAKLGLQVMEIARKLRVAGGIPVEDVTQGSWRREEGFAEVISEAEERKALKTKLHRESMAMLLSTPPL